jgi:hypothetical protein
LRPPHTPHVVRRERERKREKKNGQKKKTGPILPGLNIYIRTNTYIRLPNSMSQTSQ